MSRQAVRASILGAALSASPSALAHSPIEGLDSVYNGFLHPVFIPAHLLVLIALGLFIAQQGLKQNQLAVGFFAGATLLGLIAAWFSIGPKMEVFLLSGAAFIGLLIASNLRLSPTWCAVIAILAGLSLGMDSTQDSLSGKDKMASMFGTGIGIYFLLLYPIGLADYFNQKPWQHIGVRVIGSWIAASSLLVLALSFAPGAD